MQMLRDSAEPPGPRSVSITKIPATAASPAYAPWLMMRTGPMRHSRHELASCSASQRSPSQRRGMFTMKRNAAKPANTSAIECMPVPTQLTATRAAQVHQTDFLNREPSLSAEAAINAHTTWNDGNAPIEEMGVLSHNKIWPNAVAGWYGRGGTTNGNSR